MHPAPVAVHRLTVVAFCLAALAAGAARVSAQQDTGFDSSKQWRIEQVGKNHVRLTGAVEAQRGDIRFFADQIESWTDTNRVVATGNVVFSQGRSRIAADRADFNTNTRTGTFFNASGSTTLTDSPKRDLLGSQDGEVYFYGDEIEKIGPKKYRITRGGFTTCVQPTPRWQLTSGTAILNLDRYAFMTNVLLKAKGVPVLYLPVMYYPINKEDRATGFLMPSYGTSSYRGFTISNAFFWAVGRSHDLTFLHDRFAKRGHGMGAEYRYVLGPGSQGSLRYYRLRERESTDSFGNVFAGTKSYEIRGNATYGLGGGWSARGRVDYFSSLTTQQLYQTNMYDATRSQRSYSGSLSGSLAGLSVGASWDRSEYFSGTTSSAVNGGTPRITLTRGDRPLFGSPAYFSAGAEYVKLVRQYKNGESVTDNGLSRIEAAPVVRLPFTKLRWITVNTSVTWRATRWTRSADLAQGGAIVDEAVGRQYFDLQSRITGPVFTRVWNTPGNGYAEKWKHSIEPFVNLQRVTAIDNFDELVKLEGADFTVGGTTRIDYGITNRVMAKRPGGPGGASSREILGVTVKQTYYTNAKASQYDYSYSTSFSGLSQSKLSAISIGLTASPADRINGSARAEYDKKKGGLLSISTSAQAAIAEWLTVNAGFSRRKVKSIFNPYAINDNFVNGSATLRAPGNRVGVGYTFNYDIGRETMLNSRIVGHYNPQCCGFAVEYQTYNFPTFPGIAIPRDKRLTFSITLAGLGTFSPNSGALGGASR